MNYTSLPESQRQLIRMGYRKDHGTYFPADGFKVLKDDEYEYYLALGKAEKRKQILQGTAVYIVIGMVIIGIFAYSKFSSKPSMPHNSTPGSQTTPAVQSSNGLDTNGCYTPATVRNYENRNGCVDFNVGYTYTDSAGTVFIDQLANYTAGVEVYIPYNSSAASIDLSQVENKNIKVTGYIDNYDGAPQVTVTELSQIRIY